MFLKSETKTDLKPTVKITLQYKRSSAFCEKGKIARKKFQQLEREIFQFAFFLKESASMLEQRSPSYGRLKLGLFVTK